MSIQTPEFVRAAARATRHRIVLRFAEMFPTALARYELHAARKGGNLDHVDRARSAENRIILGSANWKQDFLDAVAIARAENLAEELEALQKRKRVKEVEARSRDGLQDPWRASAGGPLREVILTANRLWFEGRNDLDLLHDDTRSQRFERHAVEWLRSRFGDAVVHARADHDETTYHIHAIIAPWVEKTSARRGRQRLLQPSSHPLLKDYEKAQDDVGAHFEAIGLDRGERTAAKRRAVLAKVKQRQEERAAFEAAAKPIPPAPAEADDPAPPIARKHVPTPVWWAEEQERLLAERRKLLQDRVQIAAEAKRQADHDAQLNAREGKLEDREQDAANAIEVVEAIEAGELRPEIEARLGVGPLAKRLIGALKAIRQKLATQEEAKAQKAVETQLSAVMTLKQAVEAKMESISRLLPKVMRGDFVGLFASDDKAITQAETVAKEGLRKHSGKGKEEDR